MYEPRQLEGMHMACQRTGHGVQAQISLQLLSSRALSAADTPALYRAAARRRLDDSNACCPVACAWWRGQQQGTPMSMFSMPVSNEGGVEAVTVCRNG